MNVYVRELSTALARAGVECDVYTRAWSAEPAGHGGGGARASGSTTSRPAPSGRWPKKQLPAVVDEFTDNVRSLMGSGAGRRSGFHEETGYDAVHANYWLSGLAGHRLKHELDLPLVSTFHTLARVKAEASPEEVSSDEPHRRAEAEAAIMRCSEVVLASCCVEAAQLAELYDADPARIRVVAPGRRPRLLRSRPPAPGPPGPGPARRRAPAAVRGPDPAPEGGRRRRPGPGRSADAFPDAHLVVVGGPSGPAGRGAPRAGPGDRRRRRSWPTGSTSWPPSPTSCSPPTTGPPMSASCPAGRSPSGWWPWRRPPAAPRWSPPPWAGSPPWSTTVAPATWSTIRPRRPSPRPSAGFSAIRSSGAAGHRRRGPGPPLHLDRSGRAAAGHLRGAHRRAPRGLSLTAR